MIIKILLILLLSVGSAQAANYWVDPSGGAANLAACTTDTAPRCSVAQGLGASAGDTVNFKGGTYSYTAMYADPLEITISGTSGSKVTFKAATGETPNFVCSGSCQAGSWGLLLSGVSYVVIDGLTFTGWFNPALIRGSSHHIEVKNSTFQNGPDSSTPFNINEDCSGGGYTCTVSHIWIHSNSFINLTHGGGCTDPGGPSEHIYEGADVIRIGEADGTGTGANHHITIENNIVRGCGHTCFETYGTEIVLKGNTFHNPPWYTANNGACSVVWPETGYTNSGYDHKYGHRAAEITDGFTRDTTHILVESNRFGYGSPNPNNDGADGLALAAPKNIIRYNTFYGSMNNGVLFKWGDDVSLQGHGANGGVNNRFYNNTLYKNGVGYPPYTTCPNGEATCPEPLLGTHWYYSNGWTHGNVLKNNLGYQNTNGDFETSAYNTLTNNWTTASGDPKFTDPTITDPTSTTKPDLTLQSSSTAIDGGVALTTTNGTGSNSTTLIVADALYFQDGTWGASMAGHQADWIAVGTVSNTVQISSINYATNTITLASPISWSNGASVWLYKKSDGTRVLYGTAPDYGAYEYTGVGGGGGTTMYLWKIQ